MPTPTPKRIVALDRRTEVADLYRQGWSVARLAAKFQVSASSIYHDLDVVRKLWLARIAESFDALQAEELSKLDRLEMEANQAWQKSKKPSVTTKVILDEQGNPTGKRERTTKNTAGDPRFLKVVEDCIGKRVAILGLSDPAKFALRGVATDNDESPRVVEVVVDSRDQVSRVMTFDEFQTARNLGHEKHEETPKESQPET